MVPDAAAVVPRGGVRLVSPLADRAGLAEELAALWVRVTRSGGAVGFVADSPEADVRSVSDATVDEVRAGRLHGVGLERDGRLVGVGFLDPQRGPVVGHRATVVRLVVDPGLQRGGHGTRLLDGLVDRARALGITILLLGARGGTGAAEFYPRNGWTECGRVERSLRVPGPDGTVDWRDDISFVLRLG